MEEIEKLDFEEEPKKKRKLKKKVKIFLILFTILIILIGIKTYEGILNVNLSFNLLSN